METRLQDSSWRPLKEVSLPDTEEDPSSPITIVAQDYLQDPPVRDIPAPPQAPDSPRESVSVSTQKNTPAPSTDISQAIAATASAVASSVPLSQLQRSIDTFCTAILTRTEGRQTEPAQERYSLRMIEDLDFIKYQLSSRERAPTAAREGEMIREFQREITQLKQRLDEHGTFDRFLTPLSHIQQEIASLKTALVNRSTPQKHSYSPAVSPRSPNIETVHSNKTVHNNNMINRECQTQAAPPPDVKQAASVSIQTQSPQKPSRPIRPLPSPIHSSSPVSSNNRAPPSSLRHIESRLRAIQSSRRNIDSQIPYTPLPLSDILQQLMDSSDVTHRTHMLVSDKLESLRPLQRESVSRGKDKGSRQAVRREGQSGRHEKDPVYISRVYGNKKSSKEIPQVRTNTVQSDSTEITRVHKQIELIRTQMEQLACRHTETARPTQHLTTQQIQPKPLQHIPTQQLTVPMIRTTVPLQRVAKLIRPPRLMPSPYSPLPQKETPYEVITCDHAQVQTSFLSPGTGVTRMHSSPREELVTSHESAISHIDTLVPSPVAEGLSPVTGVTMDTVSVEEGDLVERMISLQANDTPLRGEQSPVDTPLPVSDPLQLMREQELGRRHLLERVQEMLVRRATESVSDQARLWQARERGDRELRLAAEVECVIKRDIITCIHAAREGLRAEREAVPPPGPEEEAPLSEEEVYSQSFVSESEDSSQHSSLQSSPLLERLSISPFSPNSTLRSLPRPTSATPRLAPSPHSPGFSLPLSPHSFLTPLSPELPGPATAVSAEVQCDMGDRTLTSPVPSSPASTVHTATPPPTDSEPDSDSPAEQAPQSQEQAVPSQANAEIQCNLETPHSLPLPSSTPIPKPSPAHVETQCSLETPRMPLPLLTLPIPSFTRPPKLSVNAQVQCDMLSTTDLSALLTDTDSSSRGTDPSYLSEGEYVPPHRHTHRYRPSSELSLGEVSQQDRLSPAVEAALRLKTLPPDPSPSPGEYLPEHPLSTPILAPRQPEGALFSGRPTSLGTPPPCLPLGTSPGEVAVGHSDSDHLSQSVTLSIAFSSPSNKTTTRHREGVDVFDVSSLEGLPVPAGWESEASGRGDTRSSQKVARSSNPTFEQPHHLFDTPHLDKSSNSTTCDVHSMESVT